MGPDKRKPPTEWPRAVRGAEPQQDSARQASLTWDGREELEVA